jgi:uncharacterized protein (TIGR02594 family)
MDFAWDQEGKKIREHPDYESFERLWYLSIALHDSERTLTKDLGLSGPLIDQKDKAMPGLLPGYRERNYLLKPLLDAAAGKRLEAMNPEIKKYFDGVRTDPERDKKGRSWGVVSVSRGAVEWYVTPWCAAFVNWCLKQAQEPHLGMATAISWLRFGTPLPTPVYGCVTIVPPSKSTGSTTGHVAFFLEMKGDQVVLLGGNQSDQVKTSDYSKVLGYRWPSKFNYYLLDKGPRSPGPLV